jgi:hypothetical protein
MFKSVENINVNRVHFTIHHYNNRKPYCHFRGGNHHNEEHKYLGRGIIKHLGKCNKQQVHGIKHQFNAHKNNNGISTHQGTHDTDAEKRET